MKNWGLKIFSLAIAAMLWFYVHSASNTSVRTFVSAVEIRRVPENKIVLSPLNPHAQVTVRGPAYIVSRIPAAPPIFTVVVPAGSGDRFSVALDQASLPLPAHVEVLNIDPPQLDFILDTRKERTLPIVVRKVGKLGEDLKIDSVKIEPERVVLVGPDSELTNISAIETEPIDMKNVTQTGSFELPLHSVGSQVQMNPARVTVRYEVSPIIVQRHFENIPIEVRALSAVRFAVSPSEIDIVVEGSRGNVEKLARKDVVAYVRVPEDANSAFDAEVSVELPKDVVVHHADPKLVKLAPVNGQNKAATKGSGKSKHIKK